jgi:hypothetical protein
MLRWAEFNTEEEADSFCFGLNGFGCPFYKLYGVNGRGKWWVRFAGLY